MHAEVGAFRQKRETKIERERERDNPTDGARRRIADTHGVFFLNRAVGFSVVARTFR